jgi:transposase
MTKNRAGKDQLIDLILTLFTQIEILQKQNQGLQKEIDEIRGQLNLDSHNSSKPPSSDGYKKPSPK